MESRKINVMLGCLSEHQMLGSNATEEARAVVDPDLELGGEPCFLSLALPAFLPSVILSFYTQNNGGREGGGPPGPLP